MKLIRIVLLVLPLCLAAACTGDPLAPDANGIGTLGSGSQVAPSGGPSYDGIGTLGSGS